MFLCRQPSLGDLTTHSRQTTLTFSGVDAFSTFHILNLSSHVLPKVPPLSK